MGKLSATPAIRHVLLAYTEDYRHRVSRPQAASLLAAQRHDRRSRCWQRPSAIIPSLEQRGQNFDSELTADLEKAGGKDYAQLATLAYRQTLAAHGFAADIDGTPMLFPKENFSNGCISTVDVLYPSAPFFLFFNPALLEAQLKPVLEYAALPRWKWPFAPHDLGTYPLANGQVYGGGERTEDDQMPVEESGNLLIMVAAMEPRTGQLGLRAPVLAAVPEMGRIPARERTRPGQSAFDRRLCRPPGPQRQSLHQGHRGPGRLRGDGPGHRQARRCAEDYAKLAAEMAAQWQTMAADGDHYKLAFDKPGTWSQKYNLVWDQILGLNLFPAEVRQAEIAFYLKHLNRFGLPLDNRADYTKLDWEIWTATLAISRSRAHPTPLLR